MRVLLQVPSEERFRSHVQVGQPSECWPWDGALRKGYGSFKVKAGDFGLPTRRDVFAHRVAFFIENGRWPEPVGRHTCDNPVCCNPAHIVEGTWKQNMEDKYERGRAVHPPGELGHNSKITNDQADEIRTRYAEGGISQSALGAIYGLSQSKISRIVQRKSYR